jgi:peptidoglycan hydrolase-like protein with peptidoglycan-binding domain
MNRFATAALAAAMSLSLSAIPAIGADSDKTVKEKAVDAKDTIKEKAVDAKDTIKEKAVEAKDKVKEKTAEAKDKVKAKMAGKAGSADVRQAQMTLKDKGHDPGPIDGIMGPRTSAAVRDFQKGENLKVNGRLDSETKTRLTASSGMSTPAASPATPAMPAKPATPPSADGSPSNPPASPEKQQRQ